VPFEEGAVAQRLCFSLYRLVYTVSIAGTVRLRAPSPLHYCNIPTPVRVPSSFQPNPGRCGLREMDIGMLITLTTDGTPHFSFSRDGEDSTPPAAHSPLDLVDARQVEATQPGHT
jgi:hypothetical protein